MEDKTIWRRVSCVGVVISFVAVCFGWYRPPLIGTIGVVGCLLFGLSVAILADETILW